MREPHGQKYPALTSSRSSCRFPSPKTTFLASLVPEQLWEACLLRFERSAARQKEKERKRSDTLLISARLHAWSRCHWSDRACHRYHRNSIWLTRDAIERIEGYGTCPVVANKRLLSANMSRDLLYHEQRQGRREKYDFNRLKSVSSERI